MAYVNKDEQREYQRRWILWRRYSWLAEHGPCVKCGSWLELEVDHIDPSLKVSHRIWSWSKSRRDIELKKCQVLCYDCHLKKTVEWAQRPITHGTNAGYKKRGCRCNECRAVVVAYNRKRLAAIKAGTWKFSKPSVVEPADTVALEATA